MVWLKKSADDNFHPWKLIPSNFLKLTNSETLAHRNFCFDSSVIRDMKGVRIFYMELLKHWSNFSEYKRDSCDIILCESLWHNNFIWISEKSVLFSDF